MVESGAKRRGRELQAVRKTLQDFWREYRDACYGKDMPAEQNRECHQAFMSGALVALQQIEQLSFCPNTDEAERAAASEIGVLIREAEEFCRLRCVALKAPRN